MPIQVALDQEWTGIADTTLWQGTGSTVCSRDPSFQPVTTGLSGKALFQPFATGPFLNKAYFSIKWISQLSLMPHKPSLSILFSL